MNTEWCWLHIHQEAFGRMKKAITSTPVLQFYVKKPMVPHDVPCRPCAKVGADLFELQERHCLLLVDYFSSSFELVRLSSSTRTKCEIGAMRSPFARHGMLEVVMLDNSPQFSCGEFREFGRDGT